MCEVLSLVLLPQNYILSVAEQLFLIHRLFNRFGNVQLVGLDTATHKCEENGEGAEGGGETGRLGHGSVLIE
jgi:hypothetical protein